MLSFGVGCSTESCCCNCPRIRNPSSRCWCWGEATDCCVGGCWPCWHVGGASIETGYISSRVCHRDLLVMWLIVKFSFQLTLASLNIYQWQTAFTKYKKNTALQTKLCKPQINSYQWQSKQPNTKTKHKSTTQRKTSKFTSKKYRVCIQINKYQIMIHHQLVLFSLDIIRQILLHKPFILAEYSAAGHNHKTHMLTQFYTLCKITTMRYWLMQN